MIYIASPYTDPSLRVRKQRVAEAMKYLSHLTIAGELAYSPVVHGHAIHEYQDYSTAVPYDYWIRHGLAMIGACRFLHVLQLDGWDRSTGIKKELEYWESYKGHRPDWIGINPKTFEASYVAK